MPTTCSTPPRTRCCGSAVGDARRGRGLVACAADTATLLTQYRGTAVEVARAQTGILLSPQGISDGELFGVRTARSLERVPGRGLLAVRGRATEIQVARAGEGRRALTIQAHPWTPCPQHRGPADAHEQR